MHEVGEQLQQCDQPDERPVEKQRRRGHQAPFLAHQAREAGEHEIQHLLRLAPPVRIESVMAAQRQAVQPVDQLRAVV
ncbi:MAG: hypothetical protein K0R40_2680, partial [Burkholderiales bacterium]|nr:hypothetical protein [Burkholderiales bacterium]